MVSQLYLDREVCIGPGNPANKDGDSSVPPSSEDDAAPPMPVKKVTRKWAAWTRSEEESFFAALRQVGKNFEKITCHVQTKNKDQVRHYYYRLVRRMNKMLDPGLCLDAKNSKDTNAAMLRWWSLLEKYSCKASKLHLKPRKFKIFIETLENQLLKDRKKSIRKRLASGENNYSMVHNPVSNQVRASGHGNRAEKVVLVDRHNVQKVGNGKRSSVKCHINTGTNRNNSEAEPTTAKATKRRRKIGFASTAENKRLETEAIAGVSLVADAAEYLERGDTNKEIEHVQETPGHDCSQHVARGVHSLPISSQSTFNNHSIQNSGKLKLQLFPIDECTQKALEMDHHNPHLELTLSTRKKISSVLEHLNRKWGNSSSLSQDLMLFPYWAQRENLLGYQKWTKDSPLFAADVYNLIGSPPVFRLRYGWFSKAEVESATAQAMICNNLNEKNPSSGIAEQQNVETENPSGPCSKEIVCTELTTTLTPSSGCTPINTMDCGGSVSNINVAQYHDNPAVVSSLGIQHEALAVIRHFETKDMTMLAADWADSITNISVEDLISESTHETDINYTQFPVPVSSNSLQQIPFSCDSFDAAIAAHLCKLQNESDLQQSVASHGPSPSIWDADETCDAFSFQRNSAVCDSLEACKQTTMPSPFPPHNEIEELLEEDKLKNNTSTGGNIMDDRRPDHSPENSNKDSGGLSDIYWPDSLGLLDLDIPFCRYNSNDLVRSDSHGGLNRLIENSLDSFQCCLLYGLDKKEPASTAEDRQTASFAGFYISSEV